MELVAEYISIERTLTYVYKIGHFLIMEQETMITLTTQFEIHQLHDVLINGTIASDTYLKNWKEGIIEIRLPHDVEEVVAEELHIVWS